MKKTIYTALEIPRSARKPIAEIDGSLVDFVRMGYDHSDVTALLAGYGEGAVIGPVFDAKGTVVTERNGRPVIAIYKLT